MFLTLFLLYLPVVSLMYLLFHIFNKFKYLRHWDDHEIQPVPRVSEKGEPIYTEPSGNNFCEWLKCIDTREGIPWKRKEKNKEEKTVKWWQTHITRTWLLITSIDVYSLYLFGPLWGVTKCHENTVGQNRTHDDHAE